MKSVLRRDDDYPMCWQQVALVAGEKFPGVLCSLSNIFPSHQHSTEPLLLLLLLLRAPTQELWLRTEEHLWIIRAGAVSVHTAVLLYVYFCGESVML